MRTIIVICLLVVAYLLFMSALARSQRRAVVVNTKSALLSSYVDFKTDGTLTNSWSTRYHVHPYTNHYVIGGTDYQCVLAADSWDYQGLSNLLVLTTDKAFLYVDPHGAVPLSDMPPGY
jgi:hypothetical protein